jgi:Protein of unknown function (DUF433)
VPVDSLIDYLEAGDSLDEFLDNFPSVSREAAIAALEEAKALLTSPDEGPAGRNLPRKLARHLICRTCRTVVECGWPGKKNGELLGLADPRFDVLLTLDKNLPYQQNLDAKRIAVLIVRAHSRVVAASRRGAQFGFKLEPSDRYSAGGGHGTAFAPCQRSPATSVCRELRR